MSELRAFRVKVNSKSPNSSVLRQILEYLAIKNFYAAITERIFVLLHLSCIVGELRHSSVVLGEHRGTGTQGDGSVVLGTNTTEPSPCVRCVFQISMPLILAFCCLLVYNQIVIN